MVSIVVPTTMRDGLFESLVESLAITGWERLEIVRVVPPGAIRASASVSPMLLPGWRLVDVAFEEDVFNFARAVNRGCEQASGSLFLIANDDLEILHRDWLELMVGQATQPRVGAVGPLLLYPDGRVQHAGVLLGSGGAAGHLYYGASILDRGYMSRLRLNQDLSCVTGACMLVRAEAFRELGGYDESFTVAFNDVDFCVRLRRAGWRIVFTPEVMLTHRESSSFGSHYAERRDDWKREYDEMRRRLGEEQDPFHNPNLRLDSSRPGALAFPPRVAYPWLGAE
jgi:hypothetical protein